MNTNDMPSATHHRLTPNSSVVVEVLVMGVVVIIVKQH